MQYLFLFQVCFCLGSSQVASGGSVRVVNYLIEFYRMELGKGEGRKIGPKIKGSWAGRYTVIVRSQGLIIRCASSFIMWIIYTSGPNTTNVPFFIRMRTHLIGRDCRRLG